jgi:hypothetical protein
MPLYLTRSSCIRQRRERLFNRRIASRPTGAVYYALDTMGNGQAVASRIRATNGKTKAPGTIGGFLLGARGPVFCAGSSLSGVLRLFNHLPLIGTDKGRRVLARK